MEVQDRGAMYKVFLAIISPNKPERLVGIGLDYAAVHTSVHCLHKR